jgi:hypothetical protein
VNFVYRQVSRVRAFLFSKNELQILVTAELNGVASRFPWRTTRKESVLQEDFVVAQNEKVVREQDWSIKRK